VSREVVSASFSFEIVGIGLKRWPNFLTVSSDFNDFSVEKNVESQKRTKPIKQRYMNWIVWLLFLFEIVHTVEVALNGFIDDDK
jgi:hypothetical protein